MKNKTNELLNVQVSCYKNYNTPKNPSNINLLIWLQSRKYENKVKEIRKIEDKKRRDKIKATLPAITPSGIFSYREEKDLIKHSGLIQFDIDLKENTHISNYDDLKYEVCNITNVAYCGLSVSGTGLWGVIPIAFPDKHKQHFEALKKDFSSLGIEIDGKPKNVASLRGYSFDDEGYFNHEATIYTNVFEPKPQVLKIPSFTISPDRTKSRVENLIQQISKNRKDITGNYSTWFELGCAFSNEFGELGREYFHLISQYHEGYNYKKTDKQFTHCLKKKYRFSISTFFHHCKNYGITTNI